MKRFTNSEVVEIGRKLSSCMNVSGVKFAYFIMKNRNKISQLEKKLSEEVSKIDKKYKKSAEYAKYDKERVKLNEKHCERDSKGSPVTESKENYLVYKIKDQKAMDKDMDALSKKYKSAIDERKKQIKLAEEEYNSFMDSECGIELHSIKESEIPESITATQLEAIQELIA